MPKTVRPQFVLNVEREELFIQAGLQDRVIQVSVSLLSIWLVIKGAKPQMFLAHECRIKPHVRQTTKYCSDNYINRLAVWTFMSKKRMQMLITLGSVAESE